MDGLQARFKKLKKASTRDNLTRTLTVSYQVGLRSNA